MLGYALKRVVMVGPLLVAISFLTFILNGLSPLDPAEVVLHAQGVPFITDELIAKMRSELGMDRPLLVRYWDWLTSCFQLNFGNSYVTGKPVWSLLGPALLNTLKLTLAAALIIIVLSIALGIVCALKEGRWLDLAIRSFAFLFTSIPAYGLAVLMIWYFSIKLDLLPTSGMDRLSSYVLPVAVIVVGYVGIYFRLIRSSMLSNLNEDYVLYGRASGLSERLVILAVLRNSMQVAVSVFGLAIPAILGSTVVVENIFAWPGLGTLIVNSILGRDFPIIQAYVLVMAAAFVLFNLSSDLVNAAMNPRLRREH
ncbi:nickel/cobalt ABC transporter permease [Paenibacillus sp. GCM10027627]|uniref:nickel/cobalt ABC transporter permease n=1 Tax=unclassified Paenibacillus TaxID=185978 RepID=UPI0036293654